MLTTITSFSRNSRGSVAVEGALLLPVFITLVFGAVDSSNYLMQSHRVEQGLTLAASYLSKSPDVSAHAQRSRQLALTGTLDGSGAARVPGWKASDIRITGRRVSGDFRSGDTWVARLETSTPYQGFGMLRAITGGRLSLDAVHEERIAL